MVQQRLALLVVLAVVLSSQPLQCRAQPFGFLRSLIQNRRGLIGFPVCPAGCAPDFCAQAATGGGLRCQQCLNNLLVNGTNGACGCPTGSYALENSCKDCDKGFWCAGGMYDGAGSPSKVECPPSMTTRGTRSTSIRACVNVPGTYYTIDSQGGSVAAVSCPADTYSPGLRKQRACVPCPTGYSTDGLTGQSSVNKCVVRAGYYLKSPGQVAPCPQGEWKAGTGAAPNCNKCTFGVTTEKEASTAEEDCKVVLPGFYASKLTRPSRMITETKRCPQGYVCKGGIPSAIFNPEDPTALPNSEPTIKRCDKNQWTKEIGATSEEQCLTPPGHYTTDTNTLRCPDGQFRPDWKPAAEAGSCTPCGEGVQAARSDAVVAYNLVTYAEEQVAITTSNTDCYIQPGQGLYFETTTNAWRAKNCDTNEYGVSNRTYGLTPAPCRQCPANMVASKSAATPTSAAYFTANSDGTGGFTDEMACVTQPGYGMVGRNSFKCDQGTYNPGDNYDTCKPCPYGTTTTAAGAGKTIADCQANAGYSNNGVCPIGTYKDAIGGAAACQTCPTFTTTDKSGADSVVDCKLCLPGYGGTPGATGGGCPTACGGYGLEATYGPAGRSAGTPCQPCSSKGVTYGFSFDWDKNNDVFVPRILSKQGAASPGDCLTEFGQLIDGAWYLPLRSDVATVTSDVQTFEACVALCQPDSQCQFVTYDYVAKTCTVRNGDKIIMKGMPFVGFKALPAGYTATSSLSTDTNAKAVASGLYIWWEDTNAIMVGEQITPEGAQAFTSVEDCTKACDQDRTCAGVTVLQTVDAWAVGTTCRFVTGDPTLGRFKRTVIRTDLSRLGFPNSLPCPSGYVLQNGTGCVAVKDVQQLTWTINGQGRCDAATEASVKAAVTAYLSSPSTGYGVLGTSLEVEVGCLEVAAGSAGITAPANITMMVAVEFQGTPQVAQSTSSTLQNAACDVSGMCSNIQALSVKQVYPGPVKTADLNLTLISYVPGVLTFTTTYSEDLLAISRHDVLVNTNSSDPIGGKLGACVTTVNSDNTITWSCYAIIPAGTSVQLTAMALTPVDPSEPLSKWVMVPGAGCQPGQGPTAQGFCANCTIGTYSPSGVCLNCTTGTTNTVPGSQSCPVCLAGYAGANCAPCPRGTYRATDQHASATLTCSNCTQGSTTPTTASTSAQQCTECAPGYGLQGSPAACTICPAGKYSAGGLNAVCIACPSPTTSNQGSATCPMCVAGYASTNCDACPVGTYSNGTVTAIGSTCTACSPGSSTPTSASTSASACTVCAPGYGGAPCAACTAGTYSVGGTGATCQACATGSTTNGTGQSTCSVCQPGYAGPGCGACPIGQYSLGGPESSTTCQNCTGGFTTANNASTSASDCNVCRPGYATNGCTACPQGFWSAGGAVSSSPPTCTACPAGSTTPGTASPAISSCSVCLAGYGPAAGGCGPCPVGKYSPVGGSGQCLSCPTGSTTAGPGSTDCSVCQLGYYNFGAAPVNGSSCETVGCAAKNLTMIPAGANGNFTTVPITRESLIDNNAVSDLLWNSNSCYKDSGLGDKCSFSSGGPTYKLAAWLLLPANVSRTVTVDTCAFQGLAEDAIVTVTPTNKSAIASCLTGGQVACNDDVTKYNDNTLTAQCGGTGRQSYVSFTVPPSKSYAILARNFLCPVPSSGGTCNTGYYDTTDLNSNMVPKCEIEVPVSITVTQRYN